MFSELLRPDADILQLGAFLIGERMKGETASELAGFVDAARSRINAYGATPPDNAVDLPCYAGKKRAAPLHLAAALQARDAGIPVFVHGIERIEGRVTAWQVLNRVGVKRANSLRQAVDILADEGLVYADVADVCPDLFRVLQLRSRLRVRSFAHTVARMLNPLGCAGQLNGMFHAPYVRHMAEANMLLGQCRSLIFMGAEGEPELYAARQKALLLQQEESICTLQYSGADAENYPKEKCNESSLIESYLSVIDKTGAGWRKAAVLARMYEAFKLVSSGILPEGWYEKLRG